MSKQKLNGQWGTSRVQTSASGTTFVALPTFDCDEVLVVNASGVSMDLRNSSETSGVGIVLPDGGSITLPVSANAQEVAVRRNDQSNTQVYVGFIYRKSL
jgi:hypothetical protein